MKQNIIAVDFDGTLCENKWPEIGMPNEELIEYLKKRQANGEKLILWTSRNEEQTKDAVEWCKEHELVFDAVNDNLPEIVEAFGGNCSGNEWRMLEMCEEDEKLKLPLVVAGQRRSVNFVTENGLYNILAQSRMEIARSWRRVVHDELINMRKEKGRNIAEQFEEWDRAMDNIYFDEETGQLMQSVTVPGGAVIQIPYEKEEE